MNQTVARIVEIMFQDVEMNEEVRALKDEVMNNCQERYVDMLARGMTEDEAIGAVVDSLKGMEEVIAQYPCKTEALDDAEAEDEDDDVELIFAPAQVQLIKLMFTSDDVSFESSMDDDIHVYYNKADMANLNVMLENGTLRLERTPKTQVETKHEVNGSWQSFSELMSDIGNMLKNVKINIQIGGGQVTIAVPENHPVNIETHVTSGDVEIDGVHVKNLLYESTSGDLTMSVTNGVRAEQIRVKGSSGDVEINADAAELAINTISGDVTCTSACPNVNVHTISGDIELNGRMELVQLKTTSGDAELYVQDEVLRSVNCNTTSGDLTVHLPAELRGRVSVNMHSTSGDVHNRFGEAWGTASVHVNMRSISGDVTLC